jgi:hypothetical protein
MLEKAGQHRPTRGGGELGGRRGQAQRPLGGLGEDAAGGV